MATKSFQHFILVVYRFQNTLANTLLHFFKVNKISVSDLMQIHFKYVLNTLQLYPSFRVIFLKPFSSGNVDRLNVLLKVRY